MEQRAESRRSCGPTESAVVLVRVGEDQRVGRQVGVEAGGERVRAEFALITEATAGIEDDAMTIACHLDAVAANLLRGPVNGERRRGRGHQIKAPQRSLAAASDSMDWSNRP